MEKLSFAQWLMEVEKLLNGENTGDFDCDWQEMYNSDLTPVEAVYSFSPFYQSVIFEDTAPVLENELAGFQTA